MTKEQCVKYINNILDITYTWDIHNEEFRTWFMPDTLHRSKKILKKVGLKYHTNDIEIMIQRHDIIQHVVKTRDDKINSILNIE